MPISWNEIRKRAIDFSLEWKDASREKSETHSFYDAFFNVFGISRRRVATFEEPVKKLGDKQGFIDLFWKGTLLVEQKSEGRNLKKAKSQALDYFPKLTEEELPRYLLVSDFQNFELYDLDEGKEVKFTLHDLHKNIEHFGFIAGYEKRTFKDQDPVNIKASELMGKLHDQLKENGYEGEELELFLVRLLFCLFADDTGIFERDILAQYIEERTAEDGSDLGSKLAEIFQVLNKPPNHRAKNLDEDLNRFPYVNGSLFEKALPITSFDSEMRTAFLKACYFNWTFISPAIFGSLFQSVMDKEKRRGIGAHYTTEQNIMKVNQPLFMDDLWLEFKKVKHNKKQLKAFHKKLASLKFLDPACGCGNFLIIAYRELRTLEIKILKILFKSDQRELDIDHLSLINVDQFYGIELEEFPARIAEVAMWLMDHQMNLLVSEIFGEYFVRIPLKTSAKIVHGNALKLNWEDVIPKAELSFILGNPPFGGSKYQDEGQRKEIKSIFHGVKGAGVLDYVTGWYLKAAQYIQGTTIKCGFVSTNSITQGEQVGILWKELYEHYGIKINFAHRTFAWGSEAKGKANVHVVIIGFSTSDSLKKRIYDYDDIKGDPHEISVSNISPYLFEGSDQYILSRYIPINQVPSVGIGNKPIDGGYYLFSKEEKVEFIKGEPKSKPYFRRWIGAHEFLNGYERWCLWLGDASPKDLKAMPKCMERVKLVQDYRLGKIPAKGKPDIPKNKDRNIQTVKLADTPTRFHVENMPTGPYLVIPEVSSERRKYIPFGYENPKTLSSNLLKVFQGATKYHFGILSSFMHMAWVKNIGGRLKSDPRYSIRLVYNNFPWPEKPNKKQITTIEKKAQEILDARKEFPGSSLADLYDPLTMPPILVKAHQELDKAVDRAYRSQPFPSESKRMEFLFDLHEKYTSPLTHVKKGRGKK